MAFTVRKLHTVRREPPWPFTDTIAVMNCTREDYDGFEHDKHFRQWSKDQALELTAGDVITDVKLPPPEFQPPIVVSPTNGWYHGQLREKQGVFSSQYVQFQYSRVPLNIESIIKAVESIDVKYLCYCFYLPDSKKRELPSDESAARRVLVEYWLLNDPAPSWRRLLQRCDWVYDFQSDRRCGLAADAIRHITEPIQDTSLTLTNICSTLDTVQNWRSLGDQLGIAYTKRGKQEMINYYITSMPSASWQLLADALYYRGEQTALTKVTSYFQRQPEPTLTIANLSTTLEEVELRHLGDILNVPVSRRGATKEAIIKEFIQNHPAPSWRLIADRLFKFYDSYKHEYGVYHTALQNVTRHFLSQGGELM